MFQTIQKKMSNAINIWSQYSPDKVEFYEPLTDKTLKHKKALLLSSAIIIISYSLNIEITSFSGFRIEPTNDLNSIGGIVFWFVLYELLLFVFSFYADMMVWDYKRSVFNSEKLIKTQNSVLHHLQSLSRSLDVRTVDFSTLRAKANKNDEDDLRVVQHSLMLIKHELQSASKLLGSEYEGYTFIGAMKEYSLVLSSININNKYFLVKKQIVTYLFDGLIPLLLAVFAIIFSFSDGFSLLSKIIVEIKDILPFKKE